MTAASIAFLGFGAWRYFQAFLFARLPSQWAIVAALVVLMEVQVSLTWGHFFGITAGGFITLLTPWHF